MIYITSGCDILRAPQRGVKRTPPFDIPCAALLFAACWVFVALDYSLQVYDEGSLLLGARAVTHEQMPLKDFWTAYPPGMFWLLALAFKCFGEQVLVNRLMHAVFVLGICVASYYLVLTVSHSRTWALTGFMVVTLYAGAIRTSYGYPPVLCTLLGLGAFLSLFHGKPGRHEIRALVAGLLAGLCAVVRYDFAIYAVLATTVALAGKLKFLSAQPGSRGSESFQKHLAMYGVGLLIPVVIAYGIVVGAVGAGRAYALLVDFPLRTFPRVRSLPFVWPFAFFVTSPHSDWSLAWLLYDCSKVPLYLPFLTAPAGAIVGLFLVMARPRRRMDGALLLGLSVLAIALVNQYRVRSGEPQGWPLAVVGLLSTVSLLSVVWESRRPPLRLPARICVFVLCVVLVPAAMYREGLLIRARYFSETVPVSSRRAAGIRIPAGEATYNQLLDYLRDRRRAGERYVYSGVVDHDQLIFNDVLVYFLSGMSSPTFFPELAPGVGDTSTAQTAIVRGLEEHAVRTVLLYDWVSTEPNESSINKNIDVADGYIRTHFRTVAHLQPYTVLERQRERAP